MIAVLDRPRLHDQVQLIVGMDDAPLAVHAGTGRYHRLSAPAAATLRLLDGTRSRSELTDAYASARPDPDAARAEFDAFLATLARSGLLDGTTPAVTAKRRSRTMPRFVVTRRLPQLLDPLAVRLRARPSAWMTLLALLGVAGASLGLVAFVDVDVRGTGLTGTGGLAFALAALLLLTQVAVHESMHALVAQVLGAPVRAGGVALLFWLLPVAYVDRTDAYRIRGRSGRVALALAGPLSDGIAAGLTATVAWSAHGLVAAIAARLLVFQTFTLILNLNPLLPSDLYVAAEAAFGLVNPRGRAFALLRHLILRRPLPPHLAALSRPTRAAHLAYGAVCAIYATLLLTATAAGLVRLLRLLA